MSAYKLSPPTAAVQKRVQPERKECPKIKNISP